MSNPIKPTLKTEIYPLILTMIALAAGIYFYFNWPERVATPWNFSGEVDGHGSGKAPAIARPLVTIGLYLLFLFLPFLDPKKER